MNLAQVQRRQHADCHRTVENVRQALLPEKALLNLVIVGHVDAGKSTLMGHLLELCGRFSRTQISRVWREAAEAGKAQEKYAFAMTDDPTEREHGLTIEVGMVEFDTEHLYITVLDAPGHPDFVSNMIAGASQADAAVLVVDCTNPLIERGQTREHLLLCRSLGVESVIVVMNKMDAVGYHQHVFRDVVERMTGFLRSIGLASAHFIPASAVTGENLVAPCQNLSWFEGPTVIDAIDHISPPVQDIASPFLMCATSVDASGDKQIVVSGRIECGYVCKSDHVRLMPGDQAGRVTSVRLRGQPVPFASAGMIPEVGITVESVGFPIGTAIFAPERPMTLATQFRARLMTFAMDVMLLPGASLVFHRHAVDIPMTLISVIHILKKNGEVSPQRLPGIPQHSRADAVFRLKQAVVVQAENMAKGRFGRFVIRAKGRSLGCGVINEVVNVAEDGAPRPTQARRVQSKTEAAHPLA
jgi:elongation factor 1 alpha-like protein